ncbi:GTPase [candidate division WOR-3 bacterium]|nr:GTPase [candidate division WOR-3 bacterium]
MVEAKNVLLLGAAGRDFHNFNMFFRGNKDYKVQCFTATQIPDIDDRKYPKELAGELYPQGIPIESENRLEDLIKEKNIDVCVFSYSDVSHEYVMHIASRVNASGASFWLLSPKKTMLKSTKPVVAVCAVRTGCGKSQTTRKVASELLKAGKKVVAVRHPMPYGDLVKQAVQRFATKDDLKKYNCTIEEMEEYEPHIENGVTVFAGVDYERILREAEKEADVILWDGGNNDLPFFKPDVHIVVVDPLRPGHEIKYHPGETNLRMADVVVINKIGDAVPSDVEEVRKNIESFNPDATIIDAASPITVADSSKIKGKKALVIEDGPTLTHGSMTYGAGVVAAKKFGAKEIVDPRKWAVGTIRDTFEKYPGTGSILPAMGYGEKQISDLEKTINSMDVEIVVIATPIDLSRVCKINIPWVRVKYDLQEIGKPDISEVLEKVK